MALSKLDLAFALVVAACLLCFEHGNRVMVGAVATAAIPRTSSICPVTDYAPFSAACLKYMDDGVLPPLRPRITIAASASVVSTDTDSPADLDGAPHPAGGDNSSAGRHWLRSATDNGTRYR
jgi:hypothetical protein